MAETVREYIEDLFGGEDPMLAEMRREAVEEGVPQIQVPVELGRLLQLLVVQTGARRILEIGTLFGYSGILMARCLPDDGRLITLEVSPKHAGIARRNFERAGVASKVEIREGAALESLSNLQPGEFDLVFIDADKGSYPAYLQHAIRLTHPGSVIVADNVWRSGSVTHPGNDSDAQGAARFNQELAANPRLYSTLIPTRDGNDAASVSVVLAEPHA